MTEVRVLGLGSFFGDDQLGWEVIKLLKNQPLVSKISSKTLSLKCCYPKELLDEMRGAKCVFLIDAVRSGQAAVGSIHRFENEAIVHHLPSHLSSHDVGVSSMLQLGEVLGILPKHIVFYGIEIGAIDIASVGISDMRLSIIENDFMARLSAEILCCCEV